MPIMSFLPCQEAAGGSRTDSSDRARGRDSRRHSHTGTGQNTPHIVYKRARRSTSLARNRIRTTSAGQTTPHIECKRERHSTSRTGTNAIIDPNWANIILERKRRRSVLWRITLLVIRLSNVNSMLQRCQDVASRKILEGSPERSITTTNQTRGGVGEL